MVPKALHIPGIVLSSIIFQMTMKRYPQGHREHSDLSAFFTYSIRAPTFYRDHRRMASARIVDGSFLYREQTSFMVLTSEYPVAPLPRWIIIICPHFLLNEPGCLDKNWCPIRQNKRRVLSDHRTWKTLMQCTKCFTEFRVDFKDRGVLGTAVFITSWKDFGQGRCFLDPKWQDQTSIRNESKLDFQAGSIFAAFEGQDDSDFKPDDLTLSF